MSSDTPMNNRLMDTANVERFLRMVEVSLGTLDPVKVERDPDVGMLTAHVRALIMGVRRIAAARNDAEDEAAGLRERLRRGSI